MTEKNFKYYSNWSSSEDCKCAVCQKKIPELTAELDELAYVTRIDRKLPFDKSHFKHIRVTYFFCSKTCETQFFQELDGPPPSPIKPSL